MLQKDMINYLFMFQNYELSKEKLYNHGMRDVKNGLHIAFLALPTKEQICILCRPHGANVLSQQTTSI
jgi:hypothetical protein